MLIKNLDDFSTHTFFEDFSHFPPSLCEFDLALGLFSHRHVSASIFSFSAESPYTFFFSRENQKNFPAAASTFPRIFSLGSEFFTRPFAYIGSERSTNSTIDGNRPQIDLAFPTGTHVSNNNNMSIFEPIGANERSRHCQTDKINALTAH